MPVAFVASLAIGSLILLACGGTEPTRKDIEVTRGGDLTMLLPFEWVPTGTGGSQAQSAYLVRANNGQARPELAAAMFVIRSELKDKTVDDVSGEWADPERAHWIEFSGYDETQRNGQRVLKGNGVTRDSRGSVFNVILAVLSRPDRNDAAWVFSCQAINPMSDDLRKDCNHILDSIRIEAP